MVRPLIDPGPTFRRIGEAVEAATHSIWVTVAFIALDFEFPEARGTVFALLDGAARRGLDVRVLFWQPGPATSHYPNTFPNSAANRRRLVERNIGFQARWDQAEGNFCHHQKSWTIDAGQPGEVAFLGGNNLTFGLYEPSHVGSGERHDVYVEIAGPSVTDAHHNFVQRWNGASERLRPEGVWGPNGNDDLPFPTTVSGAKGRSLVQMQRTIRAGSYDDGPPPPDGHAHSIGDGERTIFAQYELAIAAAKRWIYIENQALPVPEIALRLREALQRGVGVTMLVPAEAVSALHAPDGGPARSEQRRLLDSLQEFEEFTMAALMGPTPCGRRDDVYVHSKIMLVDDEWATIGSCNLHANSLFGHSEMNASFWDPEVVRRLRRDLLGEHLNVDTSRLDDREACHLFRSVARDNARRRGAGDPQWQGNAYAL